jgi:hypothetical protein
METVTNPGNQTFRRWGARFAPEMGGRAFLETFVNEAITKEEQKAVATRNLVEQAKILIGQLQHFVDLDGQPQVWTLSGDDRE